MNFPDYIEMKFVEWQKDMGKRKNVEDFAAYIGVSQATLSQWMNGKRTPGGENIRLKINRVWEHVPENVQKRLAEEAEIYETENETTSSASSTKSPPTAPATPSSAASSIFTPP